MVASTTLARPSLPSSRRSRVLALACAFALGLSARGWLFQGMDQIEPIRLVSDTRPLVPTVVVEGIRNGRLVGIVRGEARLILGDTVIIPNGSGAFGVPATELLVNQVAVSVPVGMRFVASRRGKYYYLVTSSAGARLTPENRVYFPDEASAEAAGYVEPPTNR